MFYKIISGKKKGEFFIATEINEEEGTILSQEGDLYQLDQVVEMTEEEQQKYIQVEEIAL